jgi:hypothetical protein
VNGADGGGSIRACGREAKRNDTYYWYCATTIAMQ